MNRFTHITDDYHAVDSADCWEDQNERYYGPAIDRLAAYEDTGLEPKEMHELLHQSYGPLHKKLGKWIKADQDGLLVVLPCKVGGDLISRNALLERLGPEYKDTVQLIQNGKTHLDSLAEGFTEVHNLIISAPVVEAEPVKHGRWIKKCGKDRYWFACSECGEEVLLNRYHKDDFSSFCPHCGAKMDMKL